MARKRFNLWLDENLISDLDIEFGPMGRSAGVEEILRKQRKRRS